MVCETEVARVVVAVETRIYQEGIRHLLAGHKHAETVALASNERQVLNACKDHSPDIVLLDAMMPNAIGIAREIRTVYPKVKFIVLAMSACQRQLIAFADEGVQEFLTREDSLADLCRCIDAAMSNGFWCSNDVARLLLQNVKDCQQASQQLGKQVSHANSLGVGQVLQQRTEILISLTRQQEKILGLIESGLSNKAIARQLNIEIATVKNHVHHILRKLGVSSRGEAAAAYRRNNGDLVNAAQPSVNPG